MAERHDISFRSLDDDTTQRLSEFAKENLSPQQGLLMVVFATEAADQDVDTSRITVPETRDVDQLLTKLRKAYTPGEPMPPIICCIVPVKPPPIPPPGPDGPDGPDGQ
jgi:hypothetical protein